MARYAKNAGAVFSRKYHVVFCPKYRRKVLNPQPFQGPRPLRTAPGVFWFAEQAANAWVANRRKDHLHKLSRKLIEGYSHIAIEDLNIKGLAGGWLSKSVHNAAWGQLTEMLTFKAESAGCVVVRVTPNGTTQACSGCGTTVPKDLSVGVHNCPDCGLILCRDVNAARNILMRADFQRPGRGLQAQSTPVGARLA